MPVVLGLSLMSAQFVSDRLANAAAATARGLGQIARGIRNRHHSAVLAKLDDRMLADIGLTRSDLRDAFSEPLWQDPTDALARRASERRAARAHRGRCVPKR